MEISGSISPERPKDSIDKLRMRNVFLLSFAFGIDFFGIESFTLLIIRNKCFHEFRCSHSRYPLHLLVIL